MQIGSFGEIYKNIYHHFLSYSDVLCDVRSGSTLFAFRTTPNKHTTSQQRR